jgi:hypothetical protein
MGNERAGGRNSWWSGRQKKKGGWVDHKKRRAGNYREMVWFEKKKV